MQKDVVYLLFQIQNKKHSVVILSGLFFLPNEQLDKKDSNLKFEFKFQIRHYWIRSGDPSSRTLMTWFELTDVNHY